MKILVTLPTLEEVGLGTELSTFKGTNRIMSVLQSTDSHEINRCQISVSENASGHEDKGGWSHTGCETQCHAISLKGSSDAYFLQVDMILY